jgi:predicted DNA-binding transcriptional regulator AlpA
MEFKIIEQLDRIEKKLAGNYTNKYLNIHQVSDLTSVSPSTIRRAIKRGELKCINKLGKLLFLEKDVRNWLSD